MSDLRRRPNTPGFVGYVCAFAIGFGVFAVLTAPFADFTDVDAGDTVVLFAYLALASSVYFLGLPLLILGVVLLIVLTAVRDLAQQRDHVIAAGVTAFAFALLISPLASGWSDRVPLLVALPLSMALGRTAVIPFVEDRRRRFASRPPLRVP